MRMMVRVLCLQCNVWACMFVLPWHYLSVSHAYGLLASSSMLFLGWV